VELKCFLGCNPRYQQIAGFFGLDYLDRLGARGVEDAAYGVFLWILLERDFEVEICGELRLYRSCFLRQKRHFQSFSLSGSFCPKI
jgi:hypothetical protein